MSEEASEPKDKPVEKKKGKGKLVGILVALALILGAGAAGAVLAPKYLGKPPAPAKTPEEGDAAESEAGDAGEGDKPDTESADSEEPEKAKKAASVDVHEVVNLQPIVVDTRSATGEIRHVKVGLTIELPEGLKPAEFEAYVPRAREAAIGYFRTRDFEQLSDPKNFVQVVKDLNKEVSAAVGKKRSKRVVVTDFVAQ